VHRATLPDGTPVAVKVLRPGIEDVVATDLKSLRAVLRLLDHFVHISRLIDLDVLEKDFTATFSNELDYAKEGHHAETFQRNLLWDMHVDIPQIFWERSTHRVLTMEYMDGVRIDDLAAIDASGIDRHELAVNLAGVFFHMVLTDGFFHADPHPGNVFVRSDGVIQLIDFGMVGSVTPTDRTGYAQLVTSMAGHDAMGIVRALRSLGFLGPGTDMRTLATMIEPYIASIVGDVSRMYTSAPIVGSLMSGQYNLTIDAETLAQMQQFIFSQPIILPGQATFLGKALITVVGLCLRLDPDLDLLGVCAPLVAQSSQDNAFDWVVKQAGGGVDFAKNLVPRARRLAGLVERLDDGTFELELGAAVQRRLEQSQRQQTRRILRTIVAAAGAAVVLSRWRRH
jgi:predicted unusual protein kinase regulating ubiquinone biosynthesis (AarF/ABC1/UbiB family)